jgi:hypothetical protein
MAKEVKTRNCDQCKSHHIKKLIRHNRSIEELIKSFNEVQPALEIEI